MSANTGAHI